MSSKYDNFSISSRRARYDLMQYLLQYASQRETLNELLISRATFEIHQKKALTEQYMNNDLQTLALHIAALSKLTEKEVTAEDLPQIEQLTTSDCTELKKLVNEAKKFADNDTTSLAKRMQAIQATLSEMPNNITQQNHIQKLAVKQTRLAKIRRNALKRMNDARNAIEKKPIQAKAAIRQFATAIDQLDQSLLPLPAASSIQGLSDVANDALNNNNDTALNTHCRDHEATAKADAKQLLQQGINLLQSNLRRGSLNERGMAVSAHPESETGLNLGPPPTKTKLAQLLIDRKAGKGIVNMAQRFDQANQRLCDAYQRLLTVVKQNKHRYLNPEADIDGANIKELHEAAKNYQDAKSVQRQVCDSLFIKAGLGNVRSLHSIKYVMSENRGSAENKALWQGLSSKHLREHQLTNAQQAEYDSTSAAGYTRNDKAFDLFAIRRTVDRIRSYFADQPKGVFQSLNDAMLHGKRRFMFERFIEKNGDLVASANAAGTYIELGKDFMHWKVEVNKQSLAQAEHDYNAWKKDKPAKLKEALLKENKQRAAQGLPPLNGKKAIERFQQLQYWHETGQLAPPDAQKLKSQIQHKFWKFCSENMHLLDQKESNLNAHADEADGPREDKKAVVSIGRGRDDKPLVNHGERKKTLASENAVQQAGRTPVAPS